MTEQEKFYKAMRELIEAIFIGFAVGVFIVIALVIWIVLAS